MLNGALTLVVGFIVGSAAGADSSTTTPTRHFRCRVPNAPVDSSSSTLPVCRASAPASKSAPAATPAAQPSVTPTRKAASTSTSAKATPPTRTRVASFKFAEYMNSNAHNAAFKVKPADRQKAFVETRAPAVFTPTPEGTLAKEGDTSAAATQTQAAATPPLPTAPPPGGAGAPVN